jgi:hypothetical protein
LYGTSTEDQKATTDFRAVDGSVDGLGEITRPNASAKATIFIGARMYIELLQRRTATLQRKVAELEQWRATVGSVDELKRWQANFDAREAQLQEKADALARAKAAEEDDDDDEDEDEEEEDTRKRRKPAPKGKSKKSKSEQLGGVRVFAAFAMSFSLVPSASTLLKHTPAPADVTPGHVLSGKLTPTEVISRIPLITAEHVSRLLARGLPATVVPHPHSLVDWSWRLLVALVLIVLLGPLVQRWSKRDEETSAGSLVKMFKESAKLATARCITWDDADDAAWLSLAAGIVGQGKADLRSVLTFQHFSRPF